MRYSSHIIAAALAAVAINAQQLQPLPGEGAGPNKSGEELVPLPGQQEGAAEIATGATELVPLPTTTKAAATELVPLPTTKTTAAAAATEELLTAPTATATATASEAEAIFKTPLTKGAAASNTQPPFPFPSELLLGGGGAAGASGEILTIPGTAIHQSGSLVTSVLVTATALPSSGLGSGSGSGGGSGSGNGSGSGGGSASGGVGVGVGNGAGGAVSPTATGDAAVGVTQVPVGGARSGHGLDPRSAGLGVVVGVVAWVAWGLV